MNAPPFDWTARSHPEVRRRTEEREEQLYTAAEAQRRRWWIPKAINRQIARAIIGGVKELLSKLREPGAPGRRNLLREIEQLAERLRTSPVYRARVEEAKLRLLEDAEVQAWLDSVWDDIRRVLLADLASPQSRIDHTVGAAICSLGHHLRADTAMRKRVNRTIEAMARWAMPYSQSTLGVAAAIAALADQAHIDAEQARNTEVRRFTTRFFKDAGLQAWDSQANFVFVEIKRPAKEFKEACAKEKVLVGRPFPPLDQNHARISLGTMDEMKRATEVFSRVLGINQARVISGSGSIREK